MDDCEPTFSIGFVTTFPTDPEPIVVKLPPCLVVPGPRTAYIVNARQTLADWTERKNYDEWL